MLIQFEVQNFRSFRERQTLSMVAGRVSDLVDTHTFDSGVLGLPRLLRSSAVYGPNAAGKTNLLRALKFVQSIVVNSSRSTGDLSINGDPFKLDGYSKNHPSEFKVVFIQNGRRYEYGLSIGNTRVCEEFLIEYAHRKGRLIFDRSFNENTQKYDWKFSSFLKGQREVWKESTRPNALFLSTAVQLNSKQLLPIFEWFQKRLVIIVEAQNMDVGLTLSLFDQADGKQALLTFLKEADPGISDLGIKREIMQSGNFVLGSTHLLEPRADGAMPNIVKVTLSHLGGDGSLYDGFSLDDESSGTQILFRTAGAWLNVIKDGEVLCFDEIDKSLHPLLIEFLLSHFHSTHSNPNNAQVIFTTHNVSFLNRPVLRRDQIWFVEKDHQEASTLYPLMDFKPRNDGAIGSSYLRGKYGALPVLVSDSEP